MALSASCGAPRRVQPPAASPAQVTHCDERPDASTEVAIVDAAVTVDAAASPALAHPIGEWPCSRFDHQNAATLALMHRLWEDNHSEWRLERVEQYAGEARLSELAQCHRTGDDTAWGIVLNPEHAYADRVRWQLHHIDGAGRDVHYVEYLSNSGNPRPERWFSEQNRPPRRPYDVTGFVDMFDFDGDGEEEIVFTHEGESEEGEGVALWVFRYAGGRVTRFARLANAQYLSDVDGDDRPDAVAVHRRLWETPAEFHQDPHDVCVDEVRAPMTAARSLPGGAFSISDPAVRAYNRRECPARPSTIVARDANGAVDEATTARNVVCAGAWGVRRATIEAALRACDELVTDDDCETVVRNPQGCRHRALLLQWAAEFP